MVFTRDDKLEKLNKQEQLQMHNEIVEGLSGQLS